MLRPQASRTIAVTGSPQSAPAIRIISSAHFRAGSSWFIRRPSVTAIRYKSEARTVTRACAEIQYRLRLHPELVEARQQLAAHTFLQCRRLVVALAGAIEGARHRAAIEREHRMRVRVFHVSPAIASARALTCASS